MPTSTVVPTYISSISSITLSSQCHDPCRSVSDKLMQLLPLRLDDGSEVLRSAKARSLGAEALRLDDSLRATFEALKRPRPECNLVGAVPTTTIGFVLRRLNALHVSAVKTVVLASASHPQDLTILCRSSRQGGRISDALICDKLNAGHRVSNHINIHLRSRPSNHCVACLMRAASRTKCRSPGTLPELFTFFLVYGPL